MNESLLRSIVTQPPEENYVYARGFDTLELVRTLVLNKACRVLVTAATTTLRPSITSSMLSTPTIHDKVIRPTIIPSFNGKILLCVFYFLILLFYGRKIWSEARTSSKAAAYRCMWHAGDDVTSLVFYRFTAHLLFSYINLSKCITNVTLCSLFDATLSCFFNTR